MIAFIYFVMSTVLWFKVYFHFNIKIYDWLKNCRLIDVTSSSSVKITIFLNVMNRYN